MPDLLRCAVVLGAVLGMEVTQVASIRAAMEIALDFYTTSMLKVWQGPGDVTREIMQVHNYRLREEALELYRETPKMGGNELELLYSQKLEEKIDAAFEFFCEYLKEKKSTVFDSMVFKVMHGVVTAGLAAGAIALALVELPIVAAALAAAGAVSVTGHIVHKIVDLTLAKRKRMARQNNASRTAGAANSSRTYDDDSDDEETPLCGDADDNASVASTELPGFERISLDPPLMISDEEVCGESLPRLTEEGLKTYHDRMRESAEQVFVKACYSAGKRVLRRFVVTLESELEEQFKNFSNQNREK